MENYAKEQQVLRKLEENGWEAWFVGGCVRDALRGEPCDDIDITTNAAPQEVMAVFGAENDSCVNTTLPAIMPERPAQVGREKDNACLTLTVSLSSSRFCRFRSNKFQF